MENIKSQDYRLDFYDLLLSLVDRGSFDALIQAASDFLQAPIVLTDASFRLLSLWPKSPVGDPVYDGLNEAGEVPLADLEAYLSNYLPDKEKSYRPFYVDQGPGGDFPRVLACVQGKKGHLAHLGILLGHRDFDPVYLELADILSRYLSLVLQQQNPEPRTSLENNILQMLNPDLDPVIRQGAYIKYAERIKGKPNLILVDFQNLPHLETLSEALVKDLKARHPNLLILEIQSRILLLSEEGSKRGPELLRTFCDLSFPNILTAKNLDPLTLYHILDLAHFAFRGYRKIEKQETPILNLEADFSYIQAGALADSPYGLALVHPLLTRLEAHDQKEGSELKASLRAWCRENFQIGQAAQSLFIHRNTLHYRLKLIEDLFQVSLEDPSLRRSLDLSLALEELV